MHVGVLRLTLHVPHARSLKDKRSVLRKIKDRIRVRFDVSIAEVGDQDLLQSIVFGVSVVSSDKAVCDRVLGDVARAAELSEDALLVKRENETIAIGEEMYGGG